MSATITSTSLPGLPLVARGKVRDVYGIPSDPTVLLFVATDRISAFDAILPSGIPGKGDLLTKISLFWFNLLSEIVPNHVVTADVDTMPSEAAQYKDVLQGRSMLVKKAEVVPIEAIVRGYLSGSAWKEYRQKGTVHGIELPKGLVESQQLPHVIFTPSTKAAAGQHDENIHPDDAAHLIGADLSKAISDIALKLFNRASQHAAARGLILADTKFEFGVLPGEGAAVDHLILVDEVLTPDSSRFWDASIYKPGTSQVSFDKQYLRDYLLEREKAGQPIGAIPDDIVEGIRSRYQQALDRLTGPPTEAPMTHD